MIIGLKNAASDMSGVELRYEQGQMPRRNKSQYYSLKNMMSDLQNQEQFNSKNGGKKTNNIHILAPHIELGMNVAKDFKD